MVCFYNRDRDLQSQQRLRLTGAVPVKTGSLEPLDLFVFALSYAKLLRTFAGDALASTTIVGHALFRYPDVLRRRSGLKENVDGYTATWIPVAADPEPFRLQQLDEALADGYRAIFVKCTVIAEGKQEQFQRFAFHQPLAGNIVDDQMRKVWLSRHWA